MALLLLLLLLLLKMMMLAIPSAIYLKVLYNPLQLLGHCHATHRPTSRSQSRAA